MIADACAEHWSYLGAIAAGELELVPQATLSHISACDLCGAEVESHRLVSVRVRDATALAGMPTQDDSEKHSRWSRRMVIGAATAATILLGLGGLYASHAIDDQPTLDATVRAAAANPQFSSQDPAAVTSWCVRTSGRPMPEARLSGLIPLGARMDHAAGHDIVTIFYDGPDGTRVFLSWIDAAGSAPGQTRAEARTVFGRTVLLVHSMNGEAVIRGTAPMSTLWFVAGRIEVLP
jgi:hypothetical protein